MNFPILQIGFKYSFQKVPETEILVVTVHESKIGTSFTHKKAKLDFAGHGGFGVIFV